MIIRYFNQIHAPAFTPTWKIYEATIGTKGVSLFDGLGDAMRDYSPPVRIPGETKRE